MHIFVRNVNERNQGNIKVGIAVRVVAYKPTTDFSRKSSESPRILHGINYVITHSKLSGPRGA